MLVGGAASNPAQVLICARQHHQRCAYAVWRTIHVTCWACSACSHPQPLNTHPIPLAVASSCAQSEAGFDRTGPSRARFILESLSDLRSRLRGLGSDLVVRMGRPEDVLPQLALAVGAGAVYCHREVTAEEEQVSVWSGWGSAYTTPRCHD